MNLKHIAIASDHAGFQLKEQITRFLEGKGCRVTDLGTRSVDSVDYPDYAHPLAEMVSEGKCDAGVLICGSANGVAMTANKHPKVRAAVCWNEDVAALARQHNDANVIALPARFVDPSLAEKMVALFLETPFEGGRHAKRVGKIAGEGCC